MNLHNALLALLFMYGAASAQVNLAWDASPGPGVTGYGIGYSEISGNYLAGTLDAGNNLALTVPNLVPGHTYYFAAFAYDAAGNRSAYSNEVSATVAGGPPPLPPPPPPPPPPEQYPAIGTLDGASSTGMVNGWAADQDLGAGAVQVVIAVDGVDVVTVSTGDYRPDVQAAFTWAGVNQGFSFQLPDSFKDGVTHTVRVYALDAGQRIELWNSPKTFTMGGGDYAE